MSETVDMDTLNSILKSLVTKPDEVKVNRQLDELGVLLSIQVDPQDMGIVIGRNGAMATAIKTVMKAVGKANNMNLRVQFLEPDGSLKYTRKNSKETKEVKVSSKKEQTIIHDDTPSLEDDLKDFVL
jgi:uncharacterized protein